MSAECHEKDEVRQKMGRPAWLSDGPSLHDFFYRLGLDETSSRRCDLQAGRHFVISGHRD